MNSLDFYLALLFGCKRDAARVAGKVGGLTDCVFTGLCGALPEAKGKGGEVQGAYIKGNSGVKRAVVILSLFVLIATQAKATGCDYVIFQEEKINLALCQQWYNTLKTRELLFKAKTIVLNGYITEKIAKGELEDKKFEISVIDELNHRPQLILTQGRNGYFVTVAGFPSFQQLKVIVDYFSKPDWEPFLAGDYNFELQRDEDPEISRRKIYNFYQQNVSTDSIRYNPVTVWEKDGISLQFMDGELRYVINDTPLSFKVNSHLPVNIRDRYLIFQRSKIPSYSVLGVYMGFKIKDSIFVIQDMKTIKTIELTNYPKEDCYVEVHSKWVNMGYDRRIWIYSYSYEKNRFYKNENRR